MKSAHQVIAELHQSDFAADRIISALQAEGYKIVQDSNYVRLRQTHYTVDRLGVCVVVVR